MSDAARSKTNDSGGNVSSYHLANGLHFKREGGRIEVALRTADTEHIICKVAVSEWASAVAATSKRGENAQTHAEALDLLGDVE
jgi:hypothetical protein